MFLLSGTVSDIKFCMLDVSCLQWWLMSAMVLRGLDIRLICISCSPRDPLSLSSFKKLGHDSALTRKAIDPRKVVVIGRWSDPSMSL